MALTKADIIESVNQQLGFPQKKSAEVVEQLIETIKSNLAAGEDVLVSGFGKFCVNEKKERRGRNPATGEEMMLRPDGWSRLSARGNCGGRLTGYKHKYIISGGENGDHRKGNISRKVDKKISNGITN